VTSRRNPDWNAPAYRMEIARARFGWHGALLALPGHEVEDKWPLAASTRRDAALEADEMAGELVRRGEASQVAVYFEGRYRATVPVAGDRTHSNPRAHSLEDLRTMLVYAKAREVDSDFRVRMDGRADVARLTAAIKRAEKRDRPNPRRRRRSNPLLMIVGNPPTATVERVRKAWARFHHHAFDGKVRKLEAIPGGPSCVFALGTCVALDFGTGDARPSGPRPLVCCDPSDQSLWLVAAGAPMKLTACARRPVHALTYAPVASSGKEKHADFRHEFERPLPVLKPVGDAARCRAALLDGGRYRVDDWIYD
jgi:hypothetical protein